MLITENGKEKKEINGLKDIQRHNKEMKAKKKNKKELN